MNLKITDTKQLNSGSLRGSFSVVVGPFTIRGWAFHKKDGRSWVSPPSKEYLKDGKKKHWPIVRIEDEDRYRKFQEWAVSQVAEIFDKPEPEEPLSDPNDDDIFF